jgi:magnesium-transporting ATPase (P-type)
MITGDAQETARAIAARIGIDLMMKNCLSGEEMNKMSITRVGKCCTKCGYILSNNAQTQIKHYQSA